MKPDVKPEQTIKINVFSNSNSRAIPFRAHWFCILRSIYSEPESAPTLTDFALRIELAENLTFQNTPETLGARVTYADKEVIAYATSSSYSDEVLKKGDIITFHFTYRRRLNRKLSELGILTDVLDHTEFISKTFKENAVPSFGKLTSSLQLAAALSSNYTSSFSNALKNFESKSSSPVPGRVHGPEYIIPPFRRVQTKPEEESVASSIVSSTPCKTITVEAVTAYATACLYGLGASSLYKKISDRSSSVQ